jgi:hypothetical protein
MIAPLGTLRTVSDLRSITGHRFQGEVMLNESVLALLSYEAEALGKGYGGLPYKHEELGDQFDTSLHLGASICLRFLLYYNHLSSIT